MPRCLLLLAALSLLAGCQGTPDYVSAPSMMPPEVASGPDYVAPPANGNLNPGGQAQTHQQPQNVTPPPNVTGSRAWIPAVASRPWRWIVIHHSDTRVGCAASFDRYHRQKGWDSLGYDFVIGNGTGSGDGQVEVGPRWTHQQIGAHAGVHLYNEFGIGICLVGNFSESHPTPTQMQSLASLTAWLMRTYHISPDHVIGHRDAKAGRTDCPGRYMNVATVRQMAAAIAGIPDPTAPLAKVDSSELLYRK